MDFHLGSCSNCGHTRFLEIEDREYPYLVLLPAREDENGMQFSQTKGMLVSAFTCAECGSIKFFEQRDK